ISTIRRKINLPLTVKIRAGWDQDSLNYIELAQALADAGADAICLHPRTQAQLFHGTADWHMIARLKQHLRVPVIGNGDVRSPAEARKMRELTACDAIMVGRAIIGNPWFLAQANAEFYNRESSIVYSPPPFPQRLDLILHHYHLAVKYFGEHQGILRMRKHFVRYLSGFPNATFLRQQIMTFKTLAEIQSFLEELKTIYSYHKD
ncbi:MAG: tRNA-dihydrouridine synthase, partial [Candidatus Sumerlaeia bacterium]|nr:tRNA-dihydrouridine synthase [Candidatus Sumerlaeia bacterium]